MKLGRVSESTDSHFGSRSGTKKFNFRLKSLPKNLFYKILYLLF